MSTRNPGPSAPRLRPPRFDHLPSLHADYDRRIVQQDRRLSLSGWTPEAAFSLGDFLQLCARILGKDPSPYEREDLTLAFQTVGPFSEQTCRLALEHALPTAAILIWTWLPTVMSSRRTQLPIPHLSTLSPPASSSFCRNHPNRSRSLTCALATVSATSGSSRLSVSSV
jgi:hypothetical protein